MSLALEYIQKKDLDGAERLLNQARKFSSQNTEIFRLFGVVYALKGNPKKALEMFEGSIQSNPKNFLSHSNRGNVLRDLGEYDLALKSFDRAITLQPGYAEAYSNKGNLLQNVEKFDAAIEHYNKAISLDPNIPDFYYNLGNAYQEKSQYHSAIENYNKAISLNPHNPDFYDDLGNVYQEISQYDSAVENYNKAISLNPHNPNFYSNLGHIFWRLNQFKLARINYEKALAVSPEHANSHNNLAHLELYEFNFMKGWSHYEYRWLTDSKDRPTSIITSKPKWNGTPKDGRLFIWAEQGIGDQILYGSMLRDLEKYPQTKIVSVDKKLVSIFQHLFPNFQVIDKSKEFADELYDEQISMASLGQFLRPDIKSFNLPDSGYLPLLDKGSLDAKLVKYFGGSINCGISWKSNRAKLGRDKSMLLDELAPILKIGSLNFINLQYGDVNAEIMTTNSQLNSSIQMIEEIDLYEDISGLQSIIEACDIVITTSNTTAHLAGMSGKETLLFLPIGNSRFWYWHDIDGVSLWYPSIRVFKQERPGDWSAPIHAVKAYLEKRFEI